jgi:hypothetical protein
MMELLELLRQLILGWLDLRCYLREVRQVFEPLSIHLQVRQEVLCRPCLLI